MSAAVKKCQLILRGGNVSGHFRVNSVKIRAQFSSNFAELQLELSRAPDYKFQISTL